MPNPKKQTLPAMSSQVAVAGPLTQWKNEISQKLLGTKSTFAALGNIDCSLAEKTVSLLSDGRGVALWFPPIGSANHRLDGPKTGRALTFGPNHSSGADQLAIPVIQQHFEMNAARGFWAGSHDQSDMLRQVLR